MRAQMALCFKGILHLCHSIKHSTTTMIARHRPMNTPPLSLHFVNSMPVNLGTVFRRICHEQISSS
jgi:hypothetical protein